MSIRSVRLIHYHHKFLSKFEDLHPTIKSLTKKKEKWFVINPYDPRLRTHKLKGDLEGFWSYSINYQFRILFRFLENNEVLYHDIGTHSIYR